MTGLPFRQRVASRRRFFSFAAIIALAGLILADASGWLLVRHSNDMTAYHGVRAKVRAVIDGDTLEVEIPDALQNTPSTRIVLWGVDCPEPARAGVEAQPLATEVTAFTAQRVLQTHVTLWLESHQTRDTFGRVLAHVELPDRTRLNEALLEAGLAKADDRAPHSMLTRYEQLQLNARRRNSGLWAQDKELK